MQIQFCAGPPSSGKTAAQINEISKNLDLGRRLVFIVPEQFTAQTERDLLSASGRRALFSAEVLSFKRLSYRIFSDAGFGAEKTLDDIAKNMLIRKIAADCARNNELKYFAKSLDKHGFIEEISQLFTEFFRYEISVRDLRQASSEPQTAGALAGKLADLANLFEGYGRFLSEGQIADDNILTVLSRVMGDSAFLSGAYVFIDGFFGFTPQEYAVVENIMRMAEKLFISLTLPECAINFENISEYDLFYETKQTANALVKMAKKARAEVLPPVFPAPAACGSEISHLRTAFSEPVPAPREAPNRQVFLLAASDAYAETENAARTILRLTRDLGFRYRDIALCASNLETYAQIIKGTFDIYDIPVFIDAKEDVLSHPLTGFIRAVIDVVSAKWQESSVLALFRTGVLEIPKNDLYDFENYITEFGLSGYKWEYAEWTAGFRSGRYDKEKINGVKNSLRLLLKPLDDAAKKRAKLPVREITRLLFETLASAGAYEKIEELIERAVLSKNNFDLLRHKQIRGQISHVFEKMEEILGEKRVTLKEYADILDLGLRGVYTGVIPPSADQITAGDLTRSRLPNVKALIVLGLSEGAISPPQSAALSEYDKEQMAAFNISFGPCFNRLVMSAELYIYSCLCKPSDFLFVSYAAGGLSGKGMYPHKVFSDLELMFPQEGASFFPNGFIKTKKSLLRDFPAFLNGEGALGQSAALFGALYNDPEYGAVVKKMLSLSAGEKTTERLSAESVAKLYPDALQSSVSRLTSYTRCPFSYFIKYNLEAEPRKQYQVDFLDMGSLFHAILEKFGKTLLARGCSWREINGAFIEKTVGAIINELAKNDEREIFGANGANRFLLSRIKHVAEKSIWALSEHIKLGEFNIFGTEVAFDAEIAVNAAGGRAGEKKLTLKGFIDRVDMLNHDGAAYVKIIDYKTGATKFSYTDLYYGMQAQLMLYLDYFIKTVNTAPKALPGGVFYFNINDPIINEADLAGAIDGETLDAAALAELEGKMLEKFKMTGLLCANPPLAKKTDNTLETSRRSAVISSVSLSGETAGGFSKDSPVLALSEFDLLREFENKKILSVASGILNGNIDKYPYKDKRGTGCDYCAFAAICKFDLVNETKKYREFKTLGSVAELINEIKNAESPWV